MSASAIEELTEWRQFDEQFIVIVDELLSAPPEQINTIAEIARQALQGYYNHAFSDEELRREIDSVSWFIGDRKGYLNHAAISRRPPKYLAN